MLRTSSCCALRNQHLLPLLEILHHAQRQIEHLTHNITRRERQPLRQTNIRDPVRLIQLDPDEIRRPRVLNIVAAVVREHRRVARLEVERARVAVADEDGRAGVASMEVQPFLGAGVPVEFAQAARTERHGGRGEGLADREVRAVDPVEDAARPADRLRCVLEGSVDVARVAL